MNIQCLRCKGRNFCARPVCPIQYKISSQKKLNLELKQNFFGEAPNIFVGKFGYPNISVGILGTEQYNHHDEPLHWSANNYQVQDVIDLRSALVNSAFIANVKSFKDKFLDISREVSMASKPVDVEISLNKKPYFNLSFNQDVMPHGPKVKLEKAEITGNPHIPTKIDKAVSAYDLKAEDAMSYLNKSGYDEHYLTRLLSAGNLGVKTQRKLVPTRWAITATDDMLFRHIIHKVKEFQDTSYYVYFGGYLGNYYLMLFFPGIFSYELFETYAGNGEGKGMFSTDYENFSGRKNYAENTAGGYYAARLAVAEKMFSMKRKGSCLCLRFITDEYWAPLGVWVVRQAARKSLMSKPIEFSSKELMIEYARKLVNKKFGCEIGSLIGQSRLLRDMRLQSRLSAFI